MSHTFAILEVDERTYEDVKQRLLAAGYGHAILEDRGGGETLDMNGLALQPADLKDRVASTRERAQRG